MKTKLVILILALLCVGCEKETNATEEALYCHSQCSAVRMTTGIMLEGGCLCLK